MILDNVCETSSFIRELLNDLMNSGVVYFWDSYCKLRSVVLSVALDCKHGSELSMTGIRCLIDCRVMLQRQRLQKQHEYVWGMDSLRVMASSGTCHPLYTQSCLGSGGMSPCWVWSHRIRENSHSLCVISITTSEAR